MALLDHLAVLFERRDPTTTAITETPLNRCTRWPSSPGYSSPSSLGLRCCRCTKMTLPALRCHQTGTSRSQGCWHLEATSSSQPNISCPCQHRPYSSGRHGGEPHLWAQQVAAHGSTAALPRLLSDLRKKISERSCIRVYGGDTPGPPSALSVSVFALPRRCLLVVRRVVEAIRCVHVSS